MPMTLISRQTLTGTAASVTFSSIPQTYKTLRLVVSARSDNSTDVYTNIKLSFNGVPSGTSYSDRILYGQGASALSTFNSASPCTYFQYSVGPGATASTFSNVCIEIPNYASSTMNKTVSVDAVTENNAGGANSAFAGLAAELWASTAAITSVVLTSNYGNLVAGSSFYLYGLS